MKRYLFTFFGLPFTAGWILSTPSHLSLSQRSSLKSMPDEARTSKDDDSESSEMTYYQRVFYRFTPMSEVELPKAIVIEERCRFRPAGTSSTQDNSAAPVGPRTLIIRDGNVEDGEIGDDLFTFHFAGSNIHAGAGVDRSIQTTIVSAMYLASNPELCHGNMLQLGADQGIESLLGCVGAAVTKEPSKRQSQQDVVNDILTISHAENHLFPADLERLTISDSSTESLEKALEIAVSMGVPKNKLKFVALDWRIRNVERRQNRGREHPAFSSILAAGLSFTYPEAKELARTVAHHLEPSCPSLTSLDRKPMPRFVLLTPENQEDGLVDLRHLLERGYKMATATHYLKVEKLAFHLQKTSQPESTLDELELEVSDIRQLPFTALTAQHHPEYAGGGSGELFFPMETGAYDSLNNAGEAAFRDRSGGPW